MNPFFAPTGALTTLVTTCHHLQHLARLALHEHEDQDEQVTDGDPQVRGGQAAGEEAEEARERGEGRRHQREEQETVVKRKKMPKIISRYRKKREKKSVTIHKNISFLMKHPSSHLCGLLRMGFKK